MKYGSYLENEKKNHVVTEKSRTRKLVTDEKDCIMEKGKEGLT